MKNKSHWEYRVIKSTDHDGSDIWGIVEAYDIQDSILISESLIGWVESRESLRWMLEKMLESLGKDNLNGKDYYLEQKNEKV